MPDELTQTVTLSAGDWQVILAGLLELPMKHSVNTFNRLQQALNPPAVNPTIPRLVEGADG